MKIIISLIAVIVIFVLVSVGFYIYEERLKRL